MTDTSIEWTDCTWNPVTGCTKVSPGCAHCYAEEVAKRFWKGRPFTEVRCHEDRLGQPLHWRKPRRVFVNSMSDLFHEAVPDAFINRVFAVMTLTPHHTFQVLTKRAERMSTYLGDPKRVEKMQISVITRDMVTGEQYARGATDFDITWPLSNVWLGVSVENQATADARVPLLLETPVAVRFVSCEPLLEPVNLLGPFYDYLRGWVAEAVPDERGDLVPEQCQTAALDWVIVGGESGPGARRCDLRWVRNIVRDCRSAHVPVFVKQLGARPDGWWTNELGPRMNRHGMRDRKGADPSEWPEDLRLREYPEMAGAIVNDGQG